MSISLNREGVALSAEERNKRNANWDALEVKIGTLDTTSGDALSEINTLKTTTATHTQDIQTVDNRVTSVETAANDRIDNITIEAGDAAYAQVVDAAKLNWKAPVTNFADLATSYPQAVEGDASQVTSTGAVYRFDGTAWVKIQQMDATAINEVDTRLTAQLDDKADTSYVDSMMSSITDGSPKELFYSIGALNTKYPSGTTGPMLVFDSSFTDGAHSFVWDGTAWVDAGVYQAVGLADGSVTPKKTSFIQQIITRNLFDKDDINSGNIVDAVSGSISPSSNKSSSNYIPVEPSTSYIKKVAEPNEGVAFYDISKVYISGKVAGNFTTPPNCAYVIFNVANDTLGIQQLEKGVVSTEYISHFLNKLVNEKPIATDEIPDGLITIEKTDFAGVPVSNLIKNGDFRNNETDWVRLGDSASIVDSVNTLNGKNSLRLDVTSSAQDVRAYQDILITEGHIVFVACWANVLSKSGNIDIRFRVTDFGGVNNSYQDLLATNPLNTWERIVLINKVTAGTQGKRIMLMAANGVDSTARCSVLFNSIETFDLTAVFGDGNEPTQEEFEHLLLAYPNNWFDGTLQFSKEQVHEMLHSFRVKTSKEIGIRYSLTENTTACERLVKFPVYNQNAMDNVFPYNSFKVCNITKTSWGSTLVTYEGEEGFAKDGSNGDVMVEIPKIYFKRYRENGYEYVMLSGTPLDGYILDPAFVEDGRELNSIYVGMYDGWVEEDVVNGNKLRSWSGKVPSSSFTQNQYREYSKRLGKGFIGIDYKTFAMLQRLFIVYYADRNSQAILGSGFVNYPWYNNTGTLATNTAAASNTIVTNTLNAERKFKVGCTVQVTADGSKAVDYPRTILSITADNTTATTITFNGDPVDIVADVSRIYSIPQKTGYTDNISGHVGVSNAFGGADGYEAIKLFHIENMWGNVWNVMDGFILNDLIPYVGTNMSDYNATDDFLTKYTPMPYMLPLQDSNEQNNTNEFRFYIKNLMLDKINPAFQIPYGLGEGANYTSGFSDPYYAYTGKRIVAIGGGIDHKQRAGLYTFRCWYTPDTIDLTVLGSRLVYKPI